MEGRGRPGTRVLRVKAGGAWGRQQAAVTRSSRRGPRFMASVHMRLVPGLQAKVDVGEPG